MNNEPNELKQLNNSDIPEIREEILKEQNGLCILCGDKITEKTGISLDHQHRTKSSIIGENGGGLIRGVLCRRCNVFEGKIWNNSKRFGLNDNLSDWLRTLADYLDKENYPLIHPSEKPQPKKLSKKNYNKCKKLYDNEEFIPKRKNQKKKEFPDYPKSEKPTKILIELFSRFEVALYN